MYTDKLAEHLEGKRGRKALSKSFSSCFFDFSGPLQIPIPVSELSLRRLCKTHSVSPGSSLEYGNIVVTTIVSASSESAAFAYTSPIMSGKLDIQ